MARLIFSATDYFGNVVSLYDDTWSEHILVSHVEMVGHESLVKKVIEEPYVIRASSTAETRAVFISQKNVGPRPDGIRVLLAYADKKFIKGSTTGVVATAYPIDRVLYGKPNLGKILYKSGDVK
jgi:hypothetical protein